MIELESCSLIEEAERMKQFLLYCFIFFILKNVIEGGECGTCSAFLISFFL
jgi:hypothetical protein